MVTNRVDDPRHMGNGQDSATAHPLALEFVRYIASQAPRGTPWPHIYDQMCGVARSRSFRGMGYAELASIGVSLSITGINYVCQLLESVWDQQAADASAPSGGSAGRGSVSFEARSPG